MCGLCAVDHEGLWVFGPLAGCWGQSTTIEKGPASIDYGWISPSAPHTCATPMIHILGMIDTKMNGSCSSSISGVCVGRHIGR